MHHAEWLKYHFVDDALCIKLEKFSPTDTDIERLRTPLLERSFQVLWAALDLIVEKIENGKPFREALDEVVDRLERTAPKKG